LPTTLTTFVHVCWERSWWSLESLIIQTVVKLFTRAENDTTHRVF